MATLWRGIVGPDLTIYACRASRDELEKHGGVEIRSDCSAIVVRVPETHEEVKGKGKGRGGEGHGKEGNGKEMDEKTARRLGFEVLEFVRNSDQEKGFKSG